jgi:inner membrane protease subunit 1
MAPTLSPEYTTTSRSDWVLVSHHDISPSLLLNLLLPWRYTSTPLPHSRSTISHGDLVAFGKPHSSNGQGLAIKRVIGLGGDRITRHTDGRRREREEIEGRKIGLKSVDDEVVVPRNHVWLESDNYRDNTIDSNVYGPIPVNLVVGRVDSVVWPLGRRGKIGGERQKRAGVQETMVEKGFIKQQRDSMDG